MSTNDTSYGVAATSERELTIDGAIDTFFHALLRPAALSHGDGLNRAAARSYRHAGDWVNSKEALR
jgi:hypothetical protein